jgi:hypothetical protein
MPKSGPPREDLLSVEEAADRLEITERQVWNLKKSGKLLTEEIDGRVWIPLVEISRYCLIHKKDTRLDHAFSRFPSRTASKFQRCVVFGPWGKMGHYPQFDLEVTVDDWLRLAAKPVTGQTEYEKIRAEVRGRLGANTPECFAVRFHINQTDLAHTLEGAIHRVKFPDQLIDHYNGDEDAIRGRAKEHLLNHTLLRIDRAEGDPYNYLIQSVRHFYIDLLRPLLKRRAYLHITFGGLDEDEVEAQGIAPEVQATIDLAHEKGLIPNRSLAAFNEAVGRAIAEKHSTNAQAAEHRRLTGGKRKTKISK